MSFDVQVLSEKEGGYIFPSSVPRVCLGCVGLGPPIRVLCWSVWLISSRFPGCRIYSRCGFLWSHPPRAALRGLDGDPQPCINRQWKLTTALRDGNH